MFKRQLDGLFDSWSSSESSIFEPKKRKCEEDIPVSVQVVASGVSFLLPVQSPLWCGLEPKRSLIVLPNVDPKSLARLIQHCTDANIPLEIQKDECVSLLRLAIVFRMDDIFKKARDHALDICRDQSGDLTSFGLVVARCLRRQNLVDDAFLAILEHVLASVQDDHHLDQKIVLQPLSSTALSPLTRRHASRLVIPLASGQVGPEPKNGESKPQSVKFNPLSLMARLRKLAEKPRVGQTPLYAQKYKKEATIHEQKKVVKMPNSKGVGAVSQKYKDSGDVSSSSNGSGAVTPNSKGARPMSPNSKGARSLIPNSKGAGAMTPNSKGAGVVTPNSKGPKIAVATGQQAEGKRYKVANGIAANQIKSSLDKGQDTLVPEKKNPLALSVIRKIPRTKPY